MKSAPIDQPITALSLTGPSRVTRHRWMACALGAVGWALSFQLALPTDCYAVSRVWTRMHEGSGCAVAVAPDGGVYLVGDTPTSTGKDLSLRKYSASGSLVWAKTYGGMADYYFHATAVTVGLDGAVYVSGGWKTYVPAADRALLLKYSADGTLIWSIDYHGESDFGGHFLAIASSPDGGVYVTGGTVSSSYAVRTILRKYSAAGSIVWKKTIGSGTPRDWGRGVTVDRVGAVYVTGSREVSYGYDSATDILTVRKFSPLGVLQWTRTSGAPTSNAHATKGLGVAASPDGAIYVTGDTTKSGQGVNLILRRYSPDGVLQWSRDYNTGNESSFDTGVSVAVAPLGTVLVAGTSGTVPGNVTVRKYSATGTLLWAMAYGRAATAEQGSGVSAGSDGSVYVAGSGIDASKGFLLKYK